MLIMVNTYGIVSKKVRNLRRNSNWSELGNSECFCFKIVAIFHPIQSSGDPQCIALLREVLVKSKKLRTAYYEDM